MKLFDGVFFPLFLFPLPFPISPCLWVRLGSEEPGRDGGFCDSESPSFFSFFYSYVIRSRSDGCDGTTGVKG